MGSRSLLFKDILSEISSNLDFFAFRETLNEDTYKRFAELSIMFEHSRACAKSHCPRKEKKIRYFLKEQLQSLSSDRIFHNYYLSFLYILPYISLRKFHKIEHLERCMEIIMGNKLFSTEIPPHRLMEHDFLLYKIGYKKRIPIPQKSILNSNIYAQFLDRNLVYSITHSLFYLSDFGSGDFMPGIKNYEKLEFLLGILIIKAAEEKDIDLLLELAINYFSLSKKTKVDYNLLHIILNVLQNSNFIKFGLNKSELEIKYHTYLVLIIFLVRLESILKSNNNLSINERQEIIEFIHKKEFHARVSPQNYKHQDAWIVIKSLNKKNFDFALVKKFYQTWGYCKYLSGEINHYLSHLTQRAKKDIMWRRESREIELTKEQRIDLNNQILELLKLEKDLIVRS